jgi:hypothetical protein
MKWVKPYASRNLIKHDDSQEVVQIVFILIACLFWAASALTTEPMMPANVYGDYVVTINASVWAFGIAAACTLYLVGIYINGSWRWSPALRLTGALAHGSILSLFSISASTAADGDFLVVAAGVFAGLYAWFAFLNLSDLIGAAFFWSRDIDQP